MSFFAVTKSQKELLDCNNKFTVIECEPAAGTTHGLLLKAIYEAKKGKYVVVVGVFPSKAGGMCGELSKLLEDTKHTYSQASSIFQLKKGGKIKVIHYKNACTAHGADWLLIDHRFQEFSEYPDVILSAKHVVASCYPDSAINAKNIIKFYNSDNHFWHSINPDYVRKAKEVIPEKFFKE